MLPKPTSGIWNPQIGDKFDQKMLLKVKDFFTDDLAMAIADLKRIKIFAAMKLTPSKQGFSDMVKIAEKGVFDSRVNLFTVNKLLKELK